MEDNKKEIDATCAGDIEDETDNKADDGALTDHERWTYPLSGNAATLVATGGKQLSYVHRMAQKFEELAEGDSKHWWLRTTSVLVPKKHRTDDNSDEDGVASGEVRARRSKSLECLLNGRPSVMNSVDGEENVDQFSDEIVFDNVNGDNECENVIVEERCSYDYESCRVR